MSIDVLNSPKSSETLQKSTLKSYPRIILSTPLFFRTSREDGSRQVHAPMLQAEIGGLTTLLIIDSGASDPIFTKIVATNLETNLDSVEAGTDHVGANVSTWTSSGIFEVCVEDHVFTFERPLVIDGPTLFEELGIGGILSLQGLNPNAILLLDFRSNLLQLIEGRLAEVAQDLSARYPGLKPLSLPRVKGTGDGARLVVVEAALGSSTPIRLLLNSGGTDTEIAPSVQLKGNAQEECVLGRGISGELVSGRIVEDQTLVLSETSMTLSNVVVRDQGLYFDAQVGMNVLLGTVLVISPNSEDSVLWWFPTSRPQTGE